MGGSGCGKSTLLRHLIGLLPPAAGKVYYGTRLLGRRARERRAHPPPLRRAVPERRAVELDDAGRERGAAAGGIHRPERQAEIREVASLKLALVGLAGFEDYYPVGDQRRHAKRAGLARAMALDPEILFLDEPSAGLDPISSRRLDDLILELRDSLGATIVMVTHELASIFAIANNSVYLDNVKRTITAEGDPKDMVRESTEPVVRIS